MGISGIGLLYLYKYLNTHTYLVVASDEVPGPSPFIAMYIYIYWMFPSTFILTGAAVVVVVEVSGCYVYRAPWLNKHIHVDRICTIHEGRGRQYIPTALAFSAAAQDALSQL